MDRAFIIMMIGKSHSGKTTLARSLGTEINAVVLDVDEIDLFIKQAYPKLVEFEKTNREFYDKESFTPFLKLKLQSTVLEYAVTTSHSVILSNGLAAQAARDYQLSLVQKLQVPLIAVYLSAPDQVLLERISNSDKGTDMLTVSKTLEEMFEKQSEVFVEPKAEDYENFIKLDATMEIDTNMKLVVEKIQTFLH